MMSPSGLYLTCVSARSCPERRIGLMSAVCVGRSRRFEGWAVAFVVAVTLERLVSIVRTACGMRCAKFIFALSPLNVPRICPRRLRNTTLEHRGLF